MQMFGPPNRVSFFSSPFSVDWIDTSLIPNIPVICIHMTVPGLVYNTEVPDLTFTVVV